MLPASAGMILFRPWRLGGLSGAPRIRGDDPGLADIIDSIGACSPHPRG